MAVPASKAYEGLFTAYMSDSMSNVAFIIVLFNSWKHNHQSCNELHQYIATIDSLLSTYSIKIRTLAEMEKNSGQNKIFNNTNTIDSKEKMQNMQNIQ